MGELRIPNVPDEVLRTLRARAKARGTSVEEAALDVLSGVKETRPTFEELLAETEAIREMTPRPDEQPDSTDLIREDRDSR